MKKTELEREEAEELARSDCGWEKLKGKTLLISGGTGFLGSRLIDAVSARNSVFGDNIRVINLSRHSLEDSEYARYIACDVTNPIPKDIKADYFLHLASNTHPAQYAADPVGTILTNVTGCYNMLQAACGCRAKRFLLASSVEVYGESGKRFLSEEYCGKIDFNDLRSGYNLSKRTAESLCKSFGVQYGTDCVTVRLARCFGADEKKDTKAIAQFIDCGLRGEDVLVKSNGRQRYSFCYVADAVRGILIALTRGESGEAYNVSAEDEGKTLGDYARYIASLFGVGVKFAPDSKDNIGASKATYALLDCTKIKSLGFKPEYSVSEGLKRTAEILKNI